MGLFGSLGRKRKARDREGDAPVIQRGSDGTARWGQGVDAGVDDGGAEDLAGLDAMPAQDAAQGDLGGEDEEFARAYEERIAQDRAISRLDSQIERAQAEMQRAAAAGEYGAADKAKRELDGLQARREKEVGKVRAKLAKGFDRDRRRMAKRGNPARELAQDDQVQPEVGWERDETGAQRVMDFRMLFADGIMRLDDDRWSYSVTFDDTNYTSARESDQADIITSYRHWLNGSPADMAIQFTYISKHVDRRTFAADYAIASGGDGLDQYRDELNGYVQSKISASASSMRHDRVLTWTCRAKDHDAAARQFAGEVKRFARFLRQYSCEYHELGGQARMDLLNSITKPDEAPHKYTYRMLQETPGLMVRDLVSPWSVWRSREDSHDSRLYVGSRWVKSYTIIPTGWGNTTRDDLLTSITALSYDLVISVHVQPWDVAKGVQAATTHYLATVEENNSYKQMHSKPERGFFVDDTNMPPAMLEAEQGAKATRDSLTNRNERFFDTCLVITLMCRTQEELAAASADLESVMQAQNKPGCESWVLVREQSYTTMLPIGNRKLPFSRNLTTNALSALVPFASADFQDAGGMLMGVNDETRNLILYDRGGREHTNAFILGQPHGGKSVTAKLEMLQLRLTNPSVDQIILDPEGEYVALTQALDGQVISISETSPDHVNPMDISDFYGSVDPDSETNPIPSKVSFLQNMVALMAPSMSDEERNVLDAACAEAYEDWDETRDDRDIPTLETVYEYLEGVEGPTAPDARHLAKLLYRYVRGTFSVFNHETNCDLDSRVVDYSLVDMSPALKPLAMLILLDQIWVRVTRNRHEGRQTWLWIDEMQILIDDPHCLSTLDIFWTRGRKWNMYNTGITQNAQRLLDNQRLEYMFTNSQCFVLTQQAPESARMLGEMFSLSEDQETLLATCPPGEGIVIINTKPVHFNFLIDRELCPEIYRLITTSPNDAARLGGRGRARHSRRGEREAAGLEAAVGATRPRRTHGRENVGVAQEAALPVEGPTLVDVTLAGDDTEAFAPPRAVAAAPRMTLGEYERRARAEADEIDAAVAEMDRTVLTAPAPGGPQAPAWAEAAPDGGDAEDDGDATSPDDEDVEDGAEGQEEPMREEDRQLVQAMVDQMAAATTGIAAAMTGIADLGSSIRELAATMATASPTPAEAAGSPARQEEPSPAAVATGSDAEAGLARPQMGMAAMRSAYLGGDATQDERDSAEGAGAQEDMGGGTTDVADGGTSDPTGDGPLGYPVAGGPVGSEGLYEEDPDDDTEDEDDARDEEDEIVTIMPGGGSADARDAQGDTSDEAPDAVKEQLRDLLGQNQALTAENERMRAALEAQARQMDSLRRKAREGSGPAGRAGGGAVDAERLRGSSPFSGTGSAADAFFQQYNYKPAED